MYAYLRKFLKLYEHLPWKQDEEKDKKLQISTIFNCTGVANQLQMQKHNTAI